jgi:hypothetical protein
MTFARTFGFLVLFLVGYHLFHLFGSGSSCVTLNLPHLDKCNISVSWMPIACKAEGFFHNWQYR